MVTVKMYSGKSEYPTGKSVQLSRKEPFVLRVIGTNGKVIATHRDWDSYAIVEEGSFALASGSVRDAYIDALTRV